MPSVASILADFASLSTVEKNAVRNKLLYSSVSGTPDIPCKIIYLPSCKSPAKISRADNVY